MPSKNGQPNPDDNPNVAICPQSSGRPPLARSRGFFGRGRAPRCAFGAHGFCCRGGALRRSPPRRRALRLPRQRFPRHRATRFAFQGLGHRARSSLTALGFADPLPGLIGIFGTLARSLAGLPARRRRQVDAGRLASESPMAIACLAERAPCSPWRILSISPRTNSPAWVDADLPWRLSRWAFSMVRLSGIFGSSIHPAATLTPRGVSGSGNDRGALRAFQKSPSTRSA